MSNIFLALKNITIILWEVVKHYPGVIVPFIITCFCAKLFKMNKHDRNLLEEILGLFF
ncbi:MAG: hypothetical protein NC311_15085 [Muribaculaceae bacterium]|nr:hypothetical protein [Muribaculaceae bacterium]MCM1400343.1 hypothetical protein [Clostridium sp.]MCM1461060.1 hypothetical protein [Bacteroides sp.]